MSSTTLFPPSPKETLAALYVGQSIRHVPTPAVVIDLAVVRRNCARMLQACTSLGLGWRAHVKTHKTVELMRLQVGDDASQPVKLIVSTIAEAEFLLPTLVEYRKQGRQVNILYGLPIARNALSRLAAVAQALGPDSVSILLDDPDQVPIAEELSALSSTRPHAYIKVDMGGRRAGLMTDSSRFLDLVDAALEAHRRRSILLAGLYSHAGHSYAGNSPAAAAKMMKDEIGAMLRGANRICAHAGGKAISDLLPLVVSAGASPTALSVQNLAQKDGKEESDAELGAEMASLAELVASVREQGHSVEVHAGVYPTLDLQQLAAHSLSSSRLSWRDLGLTVLAEVHAIYPGRGDGGTTEALIGAGGLALGREFCKAYEGMAMVTPWGRQKMEMPTCEVEQFEGWIVGRFSQEHGILTWRGGEAAKQDSLKVGQRVRLWPNHACITSSHFGWYFVVDGDDAGADGGDVVVDIWTRAKGW